MQKKIYHIKERIKQVAENKGIPLGKFFKELGVSSTGFSGEKIKKGVNSETIQKLICLFPDVDLHWLVTGEAKKEVLQSNVIVNEPDTNYKTRTIESDILALRDGQLKIMKQNEEINDKK